MGDDSEEESDEYNDEKKDMGEVSPGQAEEVASLTGRRKQDLEIEMEEQNNSPAPEERTNIKSINQTSNAFELRNKLRPSKGSIIRKDPPQKPALSKEDKMALSEKAKEREIMKELKEESKRDIKLSKDAAGRLHVPADVMEKSFKESPSTAKTVNQPMVEIQRLVDLETSHQPKRLVASELVTDGISPIKKRHVVYVDIEKKERQ